MTASKYITITKRMKDLTGQRFGRLVALGPVGRTPSGIIWLCQCDCGNTTEQRATMLRCGVVNSCGCIVKDRLTTHGLSDTPIYCIWQSMRARCYRVTCQEYKNYGRRGINVCDRWQSFEKFYADMGERPEGKSLDRIDNDGDYSPENCRWATAEQQQNNTRNNHFLTLGDDTLTISQWSRIVDIKHSTLKARVQRGWSDKDAITRPVRAW